MKRFGVSREIYITFFLLLVFFFYDYKSILALEQTDIKQMLEYPYVPGELLVRFAPTESGVQKSSFETSQILSTLGSVKIEENYKIVSGLSLVKLPPGQSVENALSIYNQTEGILHAQPNYIYKTNSILPNDAKFSEQWNMYNAGQAVYLDILEYDLDGQADADIDAPEAWRIMDANDFVVAVIDSGVDYNHPDLSDNMWRNPNEDPNDANDDGYPGIAGFDDDGDGLIDEDSARNEPGDPNYTNDLVNDDDENGFNDDIYGYDFS